MLKSLLKVFKATQAQRPPGHMETRFHPQEMALLDEWRKEQGTSRHEALRSMVRQQALHPFNPSSFRPDFPSAQDIDASVVIYDCYDQELNALSEAYQRISGCRSRFAVPRHAFLATMQAEGRIAQGPLPSGFGRQVFAV